MSFDLFVFLPTLPANLILLWEAQLAHHGLICSFSPGFHPLTTTQGLIPVQVRVLPNAFPLAAQYGTAPLYAELELDYQDENREDFREWHTSALQFAPSNLHPYLEQASSCLYFRTAASRTVIDFRLQYFAAATLAVLTEGIVDDPQAGQYFVGEDAVQKAAQEADRYEAQADLDAWQIPQFSGWSEH